MKTQILSPTIPRIAWRFHIPRHWPPDLRTNTSLLADYRNMVTELDPLHLFHNYLHDVIPFEQWSIPITKFRDTMVMAYNLCLGGGGDDEDTESKAGRGSLSLKVLSYRHLAMTMTSFKDTVTPHSLPYVLDG